MVFERDLYQDLLRWKTNKNRKPMLLQGARQVGKTWLIKHFGQQEYSSVAYFNLDENPELGQFFEITKNPTRIIENLSLVHGSAIKPQETLIILDEIQESNQALNALKYFKENAPDYHVIGSGSLLGIRLSVHKSFPVGMVDLLTLFPLSFSEFLKAVEPDLYRYVKNIAEPLPIPNVFFSRLVEKLRLYFVIGGMPEAISKYMDDNDMNEMQVVLKHILQTYSLDFAKHLKASDIPKTEYIWSSIPSQLSKENKKFLYQVVKSGARAREYENALLWLKNAGLTHMVYRINKAALPLSAYTDLAAFKVYVLDVGLLRQLSNLHPEIIQKGDRLFTEFKGAFAENFVLQSLVAQFQSIPFYWSSGNIAEVDFVLQVKNQIIPIEVKADYHVRSKSLQSYAEKYHPALKIRYSLRNLHYENGVLNIPLFMIDFSSKLISACLKEL